jgi:hypothetical protein
VLPSPVNCLAIVMPVCCDAMPLDAMPVDDASSGDSEPNKS